MPTSWSRPQTARLAASAGLLLAHSAAAAGFDAANNIALYWGQNSYGQGEGDLAQQSLATYCANSNVDIIPMAFAVQLTTGTGGQPVINLANSGNNCSTFKGTTTLDCPSIGDDIKTCQEKYNKTILLSIGGATYNEGGFKTEEDAVKAADLIWNTFGPVEAAEVPNNSSNGNSTGPPTLDNTTTLPGNVHNTTTESLSSGQLKTSTLFGNGTTRTGTLDDVTATPGPCINTTTVSPTLGLSGSGRTESPTDATVTPTPCGNGTTATASLRTGITGNATRTGPITATLLVGNMTATLVLENDATNETATLTSSDNIYSSTTLDPLLPGGSTGRSATLTSLATVTISTELDPLLPGGSMDLTCTSSDALSSSATSDPLLPGGSTDRLNSITSSSTVSSSATLDPLVPGGDTDRSGAALTTDIMTSTYPYLTLTATSYNDTQTSAPAEAKAGATVRAETDTNDDNVLTAAVPIRTTLETLTRIAVASTPTTTAETLDYADTHPKHKRQSSAQPPTLRPFGTASVNGFDLDLESPTTNFLAFATRLRSLMDTHAKVHQTRTKTLTTSPNKFYLTAAPQCPFPDLSLNTLLTSNVSFDAIFVQFYNNPCGVQSFTPDTTDQKQFNFATWDAWARNGSANPDVKIFLGVPAGQTAAGSGYRSVDELKLAIEYAKGFKSFGGVMAWDASQAWANKGWLDGVKKALGGPAAPTKRERIVRRRTARRSVRGEWRPRCRGLAECL